MDRTHRAQWFALTQLPELPFDHGQKVQDTWQRVREAARSRPIPFHLLPPKFSLNQLQKLYEALYQVPLDNRNFRKWVKGLPYVEALAEVETNVSHRPGKLHQFKLAAYEAFTKATQLSPY
jgi:8-oxo-dGTP diphosphatase